MLVPLSIYRPSPPSEIPLFPLLFGFLLERSPPKLSRSTREESQTVNFADNLLSSRTAMLLSQEMMEVDTRASHCNEKRLFGNSTTAYESKLPVEQSDFLSSHTGMLLGQDMMEVDTRACHCHEKIPLVNSTPANQLKMPADQNTNSSVFVNHAAIAWHENRRKWTGNSSQKPKRIPDPMISWSMTYEDLLSTNDPFPEPIPLPEMVDFLVDIWLDDGLFD